MNTKITIFALVVISVSNIGCFNHTGPAVQMPEVRQETTATDLIAREIEVGRLLASLTPGTTRDAVERKIGTPAREIDNSDGTISCIYYAGRKGGAGTDLMTVDYLVTANTVQMIRISGPHKPGS